MTRVRRYAVVLLVATLLGAASGFVLAITRPHEYRATALLQADPVAVGSLSLESAAAAKTLARTQAYFVTAADVLDAAMARSSWTDAETFRERLEVAWIPDTALVTVTFQDVDATSAARAANAVAEAFVERSRSQQTQAVVGGDAQIGRQITALREDIRALNSVIERHHAEMEASPQDGASRSGRTLAQAELSTLEMSRQTKQQSLDQLEGAIDNSSVDKTAATGVHVVEAARDTQEPEDPRALLNVIVGAFLGMALGGSGAIIHRRFWDRRVRNQRWAAAALGVEMLGALRQLAGPGAPPPLFVRSHPSSPEADDIRMLRLNLLARSDKNRSLLVGSAVPREGRSIIAANLAIASAEAGTVTVLVDADLRQPSQARNFEIDSDFGLMDLVLQPSSIRQSLQRFRISDRLFVIPVGRAPPAAGQPLSLGAFEVFLHELLAVTGGNVVIDGPPLLADADAATLAQAVDGVLLVGDPARSRPRDMRRALELVQRGQGEVLGLYLDRVDRGTLDPLPRYDQGRDGVQRIAGPRGRRSTLPTWLLLVWAALLGVQFRQDLIPNFNVAISDFVLTALACVVFLDPQLRRRALAIPAGLVWFFVAMAGALVLGCLVDALTLGYVPREGWLNKGVGLGVLFSAVACVRAVAVTREAIHELVRALLLGGIASAAIGMLVFLGIGPLADIFPDRELRFTGLLTDPNAAGLYSTACLLLISGCIAGAPFGLGKLTRVAGVVLLGIGNVVTISLSAFAAGLIAFTVLVAGLPGRRWPAGIMVIAVLVLTLPSLAAALAPAAAEGDVFQRAATADVAPESLPFAGVLTAVGGPSVAAAVAHKGSSTFSRLAANALGLELWSKDFWSVAFGVGLGAFPIYASTSPLAADIIIHNSYLWLLVELGIPGFVALVLLLWYVITVSIRLLRFADRATAIALVACFVLFLAWMQFNEGLYQRVFWLLLGAAVVLAELARPAQSGGLVDTRRRLVPAALEV